MVNKYRAQPVSYEGRRFDSKRECRRYQTLQELCNKGNIADIECQVKYPMYVNGMLVCTYVADFRYLDKVSNKWVVEDVKSPVTRKVATYRIKKKLMKALYGIEVKET